MPYKERDPTYLWDMLAHEYGRIDHKKLWTTAVTDIPELIRMLEPLIPPLPPSPE